MTFRPTHYAKPVGVIAKRVIRVEQLDFSSSESAPALRLFLEGGDTFDADSAMTARFVPGSDDYVVWQSDGYVYLNPREVFERKYQPDGQLVTFSASEDVAEFLHGVRHNVKNSDAPTELAVVVYGALGGKIYVDTNIGSLDALGLLSAGQHILNNTIMPKGNLEE